MVYLCINRYSNYMAFGLSGGNATNSMVGGDVTVAYVDKKTGRPYAVDYFLESRDYVRRQIVWYTHEVWMEHNLHIYLANDLF